jgi:hypothetical protein
MTWIQVEELNAPVIALYTALGLTCFFTIAPWLFLLTTQRAGRLRASTHSLLMTLGISNSIFLFAGAQLFFYFIFVPLPLAIQLSGFCIVYGGGFVWALIAWRDYARISKRIKLEATEAFEDHGEFIVYDNWVANDICHKRGVTVGRSPFSWPFLIALLAIAPFGPFFFRHFGGLVGHHGMVWITGFLVYPLYLYFIGLLVQTLLQNFLLFKHLERKFGKQILITN